MEMFGIMAAIPAAFVATGIYLIFLNKFIINNPRLSRVFLLFSYLVLALVVAEAIFLAAFGAVGTRAMLGPIYWRVHGILYLTGVPALANCFMLIRSRWASKDWVVICIVCTLFATYLVFLEYGVYEALFGIDGMGGPYSN